jgi:hypothetical protein
MRKLTVYKRLTALVTSAALPCDAADKVQVAAAFGAALMYNLATVV